MREGSYFEIRKGMRVVGRAGDTLGAVDRVIVDEGSDIFVGLAVKPNLFTHPLLLPGDRIDRLHEDVVYSDAAEAELQPYHTPEERYHEAEQGFEEVRT
jgi:uncharacterized protein YrrD